MFKEQDENNNIISTANFNYSLTEEQQDFAHVCRDCKFNDICKHTESIKEYEKYLHSKTDHLSRERGPVYFRMVVDVLLVCERKENK